MNLTHWLGPLTKYKGRTALFVFLSFLTIKGYCFNSAVSLNINAYSIQKTDSLVDAHVRIIQLEQLLTKNKKLSKELTRKYTSEYIRLSLQKEGYRQAMEAFIKYENAFVNTQYKKELEELGAQIEKQIHTIHDEALIAKFYLEMSHLNRELREKEKQVNYASKAITLGKIKDSVVTAEALFTRGQAYAWTGRFLPAIKDLLLSIDYSEALGNIDFILKAEDALILCLTRNGLGNEAVKKRLELIEKIKKTRGVVFPIQYLNLASNYESAGDLKNYEKYLFKTIEVANTRISLSRNLEVIYVTTYALLAELYLEKDLAKAKKFLDQSKNSFKEEKYLYSQYYLLEYKIIRARLLLIEKKYNEAASILTELLNLQLIKEAQQLSEVYQLLGNIYEAKKMHPKALKYQKLYQAMKDSLVSVRKTNSLSYYQTLYDTEKKEKEIASQELDIQSQQLIIDSKNRQQYYYIFGVLLLIVLLMGTFLFIKRIRKEKKKVASSLFEKELLLKEIHHRVKNNLQIVYGLFHKQSRKSDDSVFKVLMEDAQSRVKSMAIVHEKLYQNQSFSEVDMKEYVSELIKDIQYSHAKTSTIEVELNMIATKFHMDIAIPLGLILNELITNIYKHAFPNKTGNIWISLQEHNGQYEIIVKDNGIGLPNDLDLKKSSSMGMNLITGLCHQIRAHFEYRNREGSEFTILLNTS